MGIVALSMILSQMKVAQQASIPVMKLARCTAEVQAVGMIKMAEQFVTPYVGRTIDISL